MAIHSCILAWRIPWTEQPGRVQSLGLQRGGHDWSYSAQWKTVGQFLKLKIELSYDPAILLLGIYLKKTKTLTWKDTCLRMFIAGLFIVTKTWKQPKWPPTDEWIKKMLHTRAHTHTHTHTGIRLSHKKEWINAICSNMDGPRDYHTKRSWSDRQKQIYRQIP